MPARLTQETVDETVKEQGLVVSKSGPLAVTGQPQGMSGEIDPSDIVLPFAKLLQKTSPETNEGHDAGHFLKSSGAETEHLEFVALHIALGRTFYDGDGGKLICASMDRRMGKPSDDFAAELGAVPGTMMACRACPHNEDDPFQKLGCKLDYTLTCYDLRTEEPFLYRVRGSAQGKFKQRLISAVVMGSKPPWFAAFEMTSVLKTNERKQSWYAPELKPIQFFTDEEKAQWAAYSQQFSIAPTVHEVDPDEEIPFE